MSMKGHTHTEEHKKYMSEKMKGRTFSKESRKKMSDAAKGNTKKRGWKAPEETRRKISEALKGDKHPNWNNGSSFEPYCILFNDEFKNRVRNFFGNVCVECGKTTEENGRNLDVHHVNFNKQTCCDDSIPLFVALCRSCHNKTIFNRDYWKDRFTLLINDKYGGKCYLPKQNI